METDDAPVWLTRRQERRDQDEAAGVATGCVRGERSRFPPCLFRVRHGLRASVNGIEHHAAAEACNVAVTLGL